MSTVLINSQSYSPTKLTHDLYPSGYKVSPPSGVRDAFKFLAMLPYRLMKGSFDWVITTCQPIISDNDACVRSAQLSDKAIEMLQMMSKGATPEEREEMRKLAMALQKLMQTVNSLAKTADNLITMNEFQQETRFLYHDI